MVSEEEREDLAYLINRERRLGPSEARLAPAKAAATAAAPSSAADAAHMPPPPPPEKDLMSQEDLIL